jgi:hypothetical protein
VSEQQQAVRLVDLIDTTRPENEGVWVQFQDTPFTLRVTYYGKPQMQKMFEAAKTTKLNMRTLREEEDMDKLKFRKLYARKVIQEWKGLTVDVLRKLVVLKIDSNLPGDLEIPCTDENKEMLIEHSLEFDQWLASVTQKVDTFNAQKQDEELKN